MSSPFHVLSTVDELEHAIAGSAARPAVIFKHSPSCGTSAMAFESLAEFLEDKVTDADWFIVPVQASRAVSSALAQRFAIRHESPQALVIKDGRVAWHGSHFRVTASAIATALDKLAAA